MEKETGGAGRKQHAYGLTNLYTSTNIPKVSELTF
jgi:hypothetical protein